MSMPKKIAIALVLISFVIAAYLYPSMPEKVASHWNANGQVDGHMERGTGLFFMPVLGAVLLVLFELFPKIDPINKGFAGFKEEYEGMIAVVMGFLFYVYLLTIAYNLGYALNMTQLLAPAFAALFFYMGIVVEKAKQNWFVGIRTPWTLSSKPVWDKTHRICGKMFKAAGIIALIGLVLPSIGLFVSVALLIATAIFSFFYSYLEFEKERKGGKRAGKNNVHAH
jgi:uncharacterized membrane protein